MNSILQARLDALTAHLTTLVDSITSYNPSPAAAASLLYEDALLSQDLETLATHQRNYAALERLRSTTQKLDDQIKDSLRTLADTRKELIAQRPRDAQDGPAKEVDVNALLDTAMRIAKYTTPPTQKQKPVAKAQPSPPPEQQSIVNINTSMNTNNTQATELATQSEPHATQQESQDEVQTPTTRTRDRIPEHLRAWVEPPKGADGSAIWTPWPNENVIRSGALGRLQWMTENEIDPQAAGVGDQGALNASVNVVAASAEEVRKESVPPDDRGNEAIERRREEARRKAEDEKRKQEEMLDEFDLYDPDDV